jgi:CubicO group peptidase (beta-lactamase class C family)
VNAISRTWLVITILIPLQVFGQEKSVQNLSLHAAALQGDTAAVRRSIRAGSDLDKKDAWGSTPLMIAATFGRTDVARALIEAGADLEIMDNNGSTALHNAAFLCRTAIVRALLEKGANPFARNNFGTTPFESVDGPFDDVRSVYDQIQAGLGSLGLRLNLEEIKATRPRIAEMLRPRPEKLSRVLYTPSSGDRWKVSTPAEQGLDPALVAELYYDAGGLETLHGLLVIKNGCLIAEKYFHGASASQKALLQSVTKSFTSALVGIALDQGYLSSVNQKMTDFFPEFIGRNYDARKDRITLRHLLEMRAGFPWEETDPAYWDSLLTGDYVPMIVDFPLVSDPGRAFNYSNLTSNWLGILLARACKTDLKTFAQKHLFGPIGAELGDWRKDRDGYYIGCGEIRLAPRDMATFGLLYLNNGRYEGRQVVPSEWVQASQLNYSKDAWITKDRANRVGPYFRNLGYGYQWWSASVGGHRVDFAWGHGGQLIVLLHDLKMVVVTTAAPFYQEHTERAWRHEKAIMNVVGRFIKTLPKVR